MKSNKKIDKKIFWDKETYRYNKFHERAIFISKLIKKSFSCEIIKILDLGCSGGKTRKLLTNNFSYFGVDIVATEASKSFPFAIWDIDNDDPSHLIKKFKTHFNCLLLAGLLEHVEDTRVSIKKISFLLEKNLNSKVFISYSNKDFLPYKIGISRKEDKVWISKLKSLKEITKEFKNFDFNINESYFGFLGLIFIRDSIWIKPFNIVLLYLRLSVL